MVRSKPLTASRPPSDLSTTSVPTSSIPSVFTDNGPLPSLFVFDLDYTLWPFYVDTHPSPPINPSPDHTSITDRYGSTYEFYPEVPSILTAARGKGIAMSIASRSCDPDLAERFLKMLRVPYHMEVPKISDDREDQTEKNAGAIAETAKNTQPKSAWEYFSHHQIYPQSKVNHFRRIQAGYKKGESKTSTGTVGGRVIPFEEMLFFDDEPRNRDTERELGVTMWLVEDGVTKMAVERGVKEWRKRRAGSGGKTDKAKAATGKRRKAVWGDEDNNDD